ncbi:MAG TPA: sn-glycerol-3-phosphate ABC transporter ATP-binding protein UgpC [Spirochaetota bacterium]|nr:sn-glycerol-3-phosphate ABC transporter ATP-binding protein UgpC [Spirochaetota bacterium]HOL58035.1 sn-glycerol-3-phosphate ABC transporter ATP-binding protein UgpC [Spirochaetota bacterium]
MAEVILKQVDKIYPGNVHVVFKNDIEIKDKEFVVFVGPSGCGKSTTLRMIAGLEEITSGELYIDGKLMNDVPPKDRDIAMVFQNYALYPHMTVYDNMAFGLKIRKFPKPEIDQRVKEAAGILHIESLLDRKPKALSGGQRQRVAMGRAIVRKPKVFLFDEPLSNLDAKLRVTMRAEISKLHSRLQTTMIYVTHDQVEAMTMADKIVVMYNGHIQQTDTPLNLYNYPANKFVAGFIGSPPMNFVNVNIKEEGGRVIAVHKDFTIYPNAQQQEKLKPYIGKEVTFGVRPEDLMIKDVSENKIKATVDVIEPLGAEIYLYLSTSDGSQLTARLDPHHTFRVGETVELAVAIDKCHFFDPVPVTYESGKTEEKCII